MALLEPADVDGVDFDDVRVGQVRRMGQVFKQIANDQSALWTQVTAQDVPNGIGAAATAHVHDGTSGEVIPIPLMQCPIGADMPAKGSGASTHDWGVLVEAPFRASPGLTKIRWVGWTRTRGVAEHLRISIVDSSRAVTGNGATAPLDGADIYPPMNGLHALYIDLPVTADAVNMIRVECFDAYYKRGSSNTIPIAGPRKLQSFSVFPIVGVGPTREVNKWSPDLYLPATDVDQPTSAAFVPTGADWFVPTDEDHYADDRPISSYVAGAARYNDVLLWELLTDTPAGHNAAKAVTGHNHSGEATINAMGAEMDHPLGAWSWGVGRNQPGVTTHEGNDENEGAQVVWTGHIHAPSGIISVTGYQTIAYERFRLPAATSGNTTGGTTKLKAAVWIYHNASKAGQTDVRVSIGDKGVSSFGATQVASATTTGHHLLTFNNLDVPSAPGDGDHYVVQFEVQRSITSGNGGFTIYGACLWYEA